MCDNNRLQALGWTGYCDGNPVYSDIPGTDPSRVISLDAGSYTIATADAEHMAVPSGRLRFAADDETTLPTVGDWVLAMPHDGGAIIHEVLPRRSKLIRHRPGRESRGQIIAANVDRAFIMQGLDGNVNIRRLERYLVVVREGGVTPYVLVSKADIFPPDQLAPIMMEIETAAGDAQVILVSSVTGEGVEAVRDLLGPGITGCFIGSSGVGKSTLINRLVGDDLIATREVRAGDSKGRHTTSRRHLFLLPGGGAVIDTPGMRELGIQNADIGIAGTFPEIAELAASCRFSDCTHENEPGCAVIAAVDNSDLDPSRLDSYRKLVREVGRRTESVADRRRKDRNFAKMVKEVKRIKPNTFRR